MLKEFLLSFIPIFVAVDAIGVLPVYVGLTAGLKSEKKKKIIFLSMITALSLALAFVILGKLTFRFLGITMGDFMIAGGLILFTIALLDLIMSGKERRMPPEELGAVPIGTPLIAGPAVLTTSLMMVDQFGLFPTLVSVTVNVLIVGIMFYWSDILIRIFGHAGARVLSKVMALLLAAIAVMMIRKGIFQIIH